MQELTFLKDIFLTHAGSSHGLCLDDLDVKALLREDDDDDNDNENAANGGDDDEDSSEMVRKLIGLAAFIGHRMKCHP